jgi:hypothetical protein
MALTKIGPSGFDNITTDKIATDAITEAKIADAAIENEHLNTNVISAQSELSEKGAADDVLLVYDTSTGTLKKISVVNLNLGAPTISSISPTNVDSKDSATTTTFTVTGTNFFTGTTAKLISNSSTDISFTTVTRDSNTQLTCVLNNGLITLNTDEPYDIFVNNGISSITLTNQVNVDQRPVFVTAAGSLGSVTEGNAANFTIEATDPESAGAIRYDVVGNSLPNGLSLNTATGVISGTAGAVGADTTSTFTIQASDVDSNVSLREFSITVSNIVIETFTTSGTFAVPVGVTSVDVLVVAGGGAARFVGAHPFHRCGTGGGGAGGLIYRPGFTVTPGGTVTVTVGCGGGAGFPAPSSTYPPGGFPAPSTSGGQSSVFGTLTAIGGGYGAINHRCIGASDSNGFISAGAPGGSGGGGGYTCTSGSQSVGSALQPTRPGDSGTYGFGNAGGSTNAANRAGGGGGAGAVGTPHPCGSHGGIGRAYTIADGTTPVYYAGGGAGGPSTIGAANGGQGGGGNNGAPTGQAGQANKGGGAGGGTGTLCLAATAGGKGIVIVSY